MELFAKFMMKTRSYLSFLFNIKTVLFIVLPLFVLSFASCRNKKAYYFVEDEIEWNIQKPAGMQSGEFIRLRTISDFLKIEDLSKNYILVSDIDMTDFDYNAFSNSLKIHNKDVDFTGVFDGHGNTISNLVIKKNINENSNFGFFNAIGQRGKFINIRFENVRIVGGDNIGLISSVNRGTIENIVIDGTVEGLSNVGGIVNVNYGTIKNIKANLNINGVENIGGITSRNEGVIENAVVSGSIVASDNIGGIAYENYSSLNNVHVLSDILGDNQIGGIASINKGDITKSRFYGSLTGINYLGGIVGTNMKNIRQTISTNANISGENYLGGVAGKNDGGIIQISGFEGEIIGNEMLGGLCGYNNGMVDNSYSIALMTGVDFLGGFFGQNAYDIENEEIGSINNSYNNVIFHLKTDLDKEYRRLDHVSAIFGSGTDLLSIADFDEIREGTLSNIYLYLPQNISSLYEGLTIGKSYIKVLEFGTMPSDFDNSIWYTLKNETPKFKEF